MEGPGKGRYGKGRREREEKNREAKEEGSLKFQ